MAFSIRGLSLLFLVGCAAPQTQLAPVPKEAVKAEEEKQRELALEENRQQQQRLDSLGFPILSRGLPLCTHDSGARLSARFATVYQYDPSWRPAAAKLLGVGDTLTVVGITPGGAAYNGGLREGDRILAVEGQPVQPGPGAVKDFSTKVADARKSNRSRISLAVLSLGEPGQRVLELDKVCDYDNIVLQDGSLNAYSDGSNIVMTSTMMRFANDQELQVVYAHEFAHNAMQHLEAKKKNSLFGALLGALGDIVMASQGINTGGYYTAKGASAGAMTFSQDFEREADYVGLYAMALANVSLESAPNFWRHMAQADPKSIGLAYTHPTTAERFVRMEQTISEIDGKIAGHLALRPEMKPGRNEPASESAAAYALGEPRAAGEQPLSEPRATAPTLVLTPASKVAEPTDSAQTSSKASVGYTALPEGTNAVGDARIRRYYPIGCAALHAIPTDQQVFFQSSAGAEQDGFLPSSDC
jgi:hypothetical protein